MKERQTERKLQLWSVNAVANRRFERGRAKSGASLNFTLGAVGEYMQFRAFKLCPLFFFAAVASTNAVAFEVNGFRSGMGIDSALHAGVTACRGQVFPFANRCSVRIRLTPE